MTEQKVVALFKCLSDRSRLQILKSLLEEDMYVERLAERLGLTAPTVSFHLKKLADIGAVTSRRDQYYTLYSVNRSLFETSVLELLREKTSEEEELARRDAEYRKKVLGNFFVYGKLVSIPVQRKKERIVLEEIAKDFSPGREYSEAEVNAVISAYHEDYCTLRRDMIAEGLLSRDHGIYRLIFAQGGPSDGSGE